MDHFQSITAEIISNGQVLNLYDDPDAAEVEESHARHYYVEVVAGSTFQVKVDLTPQFNFYKMKPEHAVKIRVEIDGIRDTARARTITKRDLQRKSSQGGTVSHTFKSLRHFCKETGQWMRGDYSFGNLVLKETPDAGFSLKQAQDLGKIEVTITRIKMQQRRAYVPSKKCIATINEVPEKALKGRPIETTVRMANARPTSGPSIHTEKAIPIGGEAGKPLVFNIYYRSRRALQMMGCIPRSPSPAIDISDDDANEPVIKPESNSSTMDNSSMTRNAGSTGELLRQIQVLNARITDLERGNVKAEATNTGITIKDEGVGVKRERQGDDGNEGSRQRRRTSVKVEHVDLTDD